MGEKGNLADAAGMAAGVGDDAAGLVREFGAGAAGGLGDAAAAAATAGTVGVVGAAAARRRGEEEKPDVNEEGDKQPPRQ